MKSCHRLLSFFCALCLLMMPLLGLAESTVTLALMDAITKVDQGRLSAAGGYAVRQATFQEYQEYIDQKKLPDWADMALIHSDFLPQLIENEAVLPLEKDQVPFVGLLNGQDGTPYALVDQLWARVAVVQDKQAFEALFSDAGPALTWEMVFEKAGRLEQYNQFEGKQVKMLAEEASFPIFLSQLIRQEQSQPQREALLRSLLPAYRKLKEQGLIAQDKEERVVLRLMFANKGYIDASTCVPVPTLTVGGLSSELSANLFVVNAHSQQKEGALAFLDALQQRQPEDSKVSDATAALWEAAIKQGYPQGGTDAMRALIPLWNDFLSGKADLDTTVSGMLAVLP